MTSIEVAPITWVDVARRLASFDASSKDRPIEIVRARASWFGLTLECSSKPDENAVANWLDQVFPRRVTRSPLSLKLDGPTGSLSVDLEQALPNISPRLSLGIIDGIVDFLPEKQAVSTRPIPIVACLSVKGGTGRTTSAIALATSWASTVGSRVLLVDADLEAPGITYLYESVATSPSISLEDIIVLAHGSENSEANDVVEFAAEKLRDQSLSNEITVLPLRRDADELASSSIRAEHLSTPDHPFALADLLSRIGSKLGCCGVVIDVRAGLVPLGANLALDPDVSPVFVTTLSSQSIRATNALTAFLSREVRRAGRVPRRPLLIINRVPSVFKQSGMDSRIVGPLVEQMINSLVEGTGSGGLSDSAEEVEPLVQTSVPELPDLQVMSGSWEEFSSQLKNSGFYSVTNSAFNTWIQSELRADAASAEDIVSANSTHTKDDAQKQLHEFATNLIAAEGVEGAVPKPLVISALANLVRRFQSDVPIAVCEGAKGTGKTMAARYFVAEGSWVRVCSALAGVTDASDAVIIPVVGSLQASSAVQDEFDTARRHAADTLGLTGRSTFFKTLQYIKSELNKQHSETEWVDIWLDVAAWSAGFGDGAVGAGGRFIEILREMSRRAVLIFEGLEELYQRTSDNGVEVAMRALLVLLPQRLRTEAGRPLGAIIFARRDTVSAAVKQNIDQYRREYSHFALSWTEDDVLELAAWIATQSGALPGLWGANFAALSNDEKKRCLEPLWGRKLGPDDEPSRRTKEAYTASWVIAVLSDLRGRLVPRDFVRLLATAANIQPDLEERSSFPTRLLIPRSIRSAISFTSEKKVDETKEEIPELRGIFEKFQAHVDEVAVPLTESALKILQISNDEVKTLVRHGVVFEEGAMLEVPELFRRGLGLRHNGARRSVVNLHWRAKQRAADL